MSFGRRSPSKLLSRKLGRVAVTSPNGVPIEDRLRNSGAPDSAARTAPISADGHTGTDRTRRPPRNDDSMYGRKLLQPLHPIRVLGSLLRPDHRAKALAADRTLPVPHPPAGRCLGAQEVSGAPFQNGTYLDHCAGAGCRVTASGNWRGSPSAIWLHRPSRRRSFCGTPRAILVPTQCGCSLHPLAV
jgi:hypothetical protein